MHLFLSASNFSPSTQPPCVAHCDSELHCPPPNVSLLGTAQQFSPEAQSSDVMHLLSSDGRQYWRSTWLVNFFSPSAHPHEDEDQGVVQDPPQQLVGVPEEQSLLEVQPLVPGIPDLQMPFWQVFVSVVSTQCVLPPGAHFVHAWPSTLPAHGSYGASQLKLPLASVSVSPFTQFLHDHGVLHRPKLAAAPVSPSSMQHCVDVPNVHSALELQMCS